MTEEVSRAAAWSKDQELDIEFNNSINMATLVGLWQQLVLLLQPPAE